MAVLVAAGERPSSFAAELAWEWGHWVIDHGLPALPSDLAPGESVPVAWWRGPAVAAVLHIYRRDPSVDDDEGPQLETDVQVMRRLDDRWVDVDGGGGTNWSAGVVLEAPDLPLDAVHHGTFEFRHSTEWAVAAWDGVVGIDADGVAVEQDGRRHQQPIDSPLRAFVVAFDALLPARVQVISRSGDLLLDATSAGRAT
jgi:hypothetical protein